MATLKTRTIYQTALTILNNTVSGEPAKRHNMSMCEAIREAIQQFDSSYDIKPNYISRVFKFSAPSTQRWNEHYWWPLTDLASRQAYLTNLINTTSATATPDMTLMNQYNGRK